MSYLACLINNQLYRAGVDDVLFPVNTLLERGGVVLRINGDTGLNNALTRIQFLCHIMHGCAVIFFTRIKHALMRIESFLRGQQRGVNIDNFAGEVLNKQRGQNAHESGKDNQIRRMRCNGFNEPLIILASGLAFDWFNHSAIYSDVPGSIQTICIWPVANEQANAGV